MFTFLNLVILLTDTTGRQMVRSAVSDGHSMKQTAVLSNLMVLQMPVVLLTPSLRGDIAQDAPQQHLFCAFIYHESSCHLKNKFHFLLLEILQGLGEGVKETSGRTRGLILMQPDFSCLLRHPKILFLTSYLITEMDGGDCVIIGSCCLIVFSSTHSLNYCRRKGRGAVQCHNRAPGGGIVLAN